MIHRWRVESWYHRPAPGKWRAIPDGYWRVEDLQIAKSQAKRLADDGERTRVIDVLNNKVMASYGEVRR